MRSASVISCQRQPHRWHNWLEGKNRSTLTTVPPTEVTLLVSNVSRRPSAASEKERASLRFCISPFTCNDSTPTKPYVVAISVVSLCNRSSRAQATRECRRASFSFAFYQFLDPLTRRARRLLA